MIISLGFASFDTDFSFTRDANTIGEERTDTKAKMSTRKIIPKHI
jgi:hypothetical protein